MSNQYLTIMKTLFRRLLIMFALSVFMVSFNLNAQEWTKEQKEVWKQVKSMWVNWSASDIDAAFAGVHDNYLGWNNSNPMPVSKAKWVEPMKKRNDKVTDRDFDIEPVRILVVDDAAVVHYYYSMWWVYNNGDKKINGKSSGKWTEFFVRQDGKWMLIGDFTFENTD